MFSKEKKQYINILQQSKHLKLDYKSFEDNKIIKTEQTSYIKGSSSDAPEDLTLKVNLLQESIDETYISTLYESSDQFIVDDEAIDHITTKAIKLTHNKSITTPKINIDNYIRYFDKTGLDYLFSPYSIVYEYILSNNKKNSLNLFMHNDTVYMIIVDNKLNVLFSSIKQLTPFDKTKDENFVDDEIVRQKLYEELHLLEMQELLNEVVQEYYSKYSNDQFLDEVNIIYNIKTLLDTQIKSLEESLLLIINHEQIDILSYMYNLSQKTNARTYSFIEPREKADKKSQLTWLFLAISSIVATIVFFYYMLQDTKQSKQPTQKNITQQKQHKQIAQTKQQPKKIKKNITALLQDHNQKNKDIQNYILMLFDVVPYDAMLNDLNIDKDSATYIVNFAPKSDSLANMQIKLKNIYQDSKVLLNHKNQTNTNTIIQNKGLKIKFETKYKQYQVKKGITISKAVQILKSIGIKNSIIKLIDKKVNQDNILHYKFSVVSKVKSPNQFFDFVDKLNKQQFSIHIALPIRFTKTKDKLTIKYIVQFNQKNI
jgi:hypothetical protein